MANRGERKRQKSISAPKVRGFPRKEDTFTPKSKPGPHTKWTSVPASFALRQILQLTMNKKETRKVLADGGFKVNGVVRRKLSFPVGLFDVVELAALRKKCRFFFDGKGRLVAKEIDNKGGNFKVSKIVGKRIAKGGRMMATTDDGYSIELGKEKVNVDDSVKISLPEKKILEVYPMGKGTTAFIVAGTHAGKTVKVEGVTRGSLKTHTVVAFEDRGEHYQTVIDNVFIVGKGKAEIEALA